MRIFLWLLTLFAIAIGLAVGAKFNSGNIVLFYPPYRVDLSLNFFLLLAVFLFFMIHFVLNAIRSTQQMPERVATYRRQKRERESSRALRDALKALFEGRFGHAEKAATRAAKLPDNAGLSALIGARAAHCIHQAERRDIWLLKAQNDRSLKTARLITTIELQIDDHQPEMALESIAELNASGARHIHVLRLALKANQRAKNWPEVLRLVRLLDKRSALHPALSRRLSELAYEDLLSDPAYDAESIHHVLAAIPEEDHVKPFVAMRVAQAFNVRNLHGVARNVIEKALAVEWDDRLVRIYRDSAEAEGSPALLAQIERCEEWMVKYSSDAELALTLGTLCLRQKLWGKAQHYLQQVLSDTIKPSTVREANLKLAQLHEALNQFEEAAVHYRECALTVVES